MRLTLIFTFILLENVVQADSSIQRFPAASLLLNLFWESVK